MRTSSWLEASWLQPGTALAQAFQGVLTGRPLCQHSSNFLQGLQLHQDYRSQEEFSTWAGEGAAVCPWATRLDYSKVELDCVWDWQRPWGS